MIQKRMEERPYTTAVMSPAWAKAVVATWLFPFYIIREERPRQCESP